MEEEVSLDPFHFLTGPRTCGLLHVLDLCATEENFKAKTSLELLNNKISWVYLHIVVGC